MSHTFPPHEPGRQGWAELLTLVGAVRRLAFARNLPPAEALGRIRTHSATMTSKGHRLRELQAEPPFSLSHMHLCRSAQRLASRCF